MPGFGIGKDGKRVCIAYATWMTTMAERKYRVTEVEVAASIYTLKHFEVYLLGNKTIVY